MTTAKTKNVGRTYAQLIKFGRLLESHEKAQAMCDEHPEVILAFVDSIDRRLLWTKIDDFFSLFPPVKRYEDDGMWDYKSTIEMRREQLGTHFGKNDFKKLIVTSCYENKYLHLVGISSMWSVSRMHKARTGGSLFLDFLAAKTE